MSLNKDQEDLYKKTMDEVKRQLDGIDEEVEKELQKVRKRLAELQESKKSLLGIEVEAEENEETDQTQSMAKM
jgi:ABC-type Zn uptake system ZnuABC Zn-binding protein ZnuA